MLHALLALAIAASGSADRSSATTLATSTQPSSDAMVLPLVSFNSDEGAGFGVAGGAYFYGDGVKPYRHAFAGQTFFTTGGVHSHFLRYDGPRFLGSGLRLEARLDYRRERFAPYYGPGNNSAPEYAGEERSRFYSYDRLGTGGWIRLRGGGAESPVQPYFGWGYRRTLVRPNPGSLLEQQAPPGLEGGATGQLIVGLVRDTRDDESDTTRGASQELALRLAGRATGSAYTFGQATFTARGFLPMGRRLVLAGRVAGDWIFGEAPFYEWPNLGGLAGAEGIGGISSVRGIDRHRYTGDLKLLVNAEMRATLGNPRLFGERFKVAGVLFGDAGRAWSELTADGPWYRLRPAAGLGLRVVKGAAVARLDYGFSQGGQGLYLMFGHLV
jgi:outer membrane protein assembly factor BamA